MTTTLACLGLATAAAPLAHAPILRAGLSIPDTMFLMVLALVVFGPRRLPEIGRQIGKLMYELRKASNDFRFQIEEELRQADEADKQKKLEQSRAEASQITQGQTQAEPATIDQQTQDPYNTLPAASQPLTSASEPSERVFAVNDAADATAGTLNPMPQEPNTPSIHLPATGEPVEGVRPGYRAPATEEAPQGSTFHSSSLQTSEQDQQAEQGLITETMTSHE